MTTANLADPRPGVPTVGPAARYWLAAAAAVGPLSVAADQLALPYSVTAGGDDAVAAAVAHPAAMDVALWLDLISAVTLLAGVLVACVVAVRTAPRLAAAAAVASAIGFGALPVTGIAFDLIAATAVGPGADPAAAARVLDAASAQPMAVVALVAFLAGQLIGLVLLGVAVWRTAPRWAAVALILSGPLHVIFPGLVPGVVLGSLTWVLTAVALAVIVVTAGRHRAVRA